MAHSVRLWLETQRYWVRMAAESDVCHRGCAYTVFQTIQTPAVPFMILCTIKNPWSHPIREGHSPDFGFPSVVTLPWLCRQRRKAIFPHSLHGPRESPWSSARWSRKTTIERVRSRKRRSRWLGCDTGFLSPLWSGCEIRALENLNRSIHISPVDGYSSLPQARLPLGPRPVAGINWLSYSVEM